MSVLRIYDPRSPNLHGYPVFRPDPSLREVFAGKLLKWWSEAIWTIYGRDQIVAWYLHREQSLVGRIENLMAKQILIYLYGKPRA